MRIFCNYVVAAALFFFLSPLSASAAEPLQLYAAGSLKAALSEVALAYENTYAAKVATRFGPSGLLTTAIEGGENPDVFASANMAHPAKLAASGWGGPVVLFARNQLCALAQKDVSATSDNLLSTLLDNTVRLGTSTPKADPSGDYAWELFSKAEAIQKGSYATLSGKALQLTGGPDSDKAPEKRNQYGWVMDEKKADVFLTYCTNAVSAQKEVQSLKIVSIPENLAVGADYGLVVRNGASPEAWRLAMYILSPEGQTILQKYGFEVSVVKKGK
ncbi:molybdate ABC transporter substrate-binding protein [Desulfoprunum benzoelyticum]|uniref:ABC-type molybdate transport system substrate-binding protein n=1 Tax=Desulfoprunum benzoelyticum TaxID=1506996 RepID=A0A840V3A4_9BACT|nr:molybdate ABC transporter substrate-binding protein [Desulfoprunum benzoelyticum]MBB5349308.1 ABC-type molybdate transport system substrate-binding protein [Desulfoprunum benzoelyticum]MBM9529165.1 molybdate ABC transporter substrate-binding protein [Desulfoprunum benzoelyticum]